GRGAALGIEDDDSVIQAAGRRGIGVALGMWPQVWSSGGTATAAKLGGGDGCVERGEGQGDNAGSRRGNGDYGRGMVELGAS
ncbi:hypothetical protein E2562_014154, partial [Oryza meyeriana var. granulata]